MPGAPVTRKPVTPKRSKVWNQGPLRAGTHTLDEDVQAPQVDERIDHDLPRPMEGDLAAALWSAMTGIGPGSSSVQFARDALREGGWVLADPEFIWSVGVARGGEGTHRVERGQVLDLPQSFDDHSTT